MKHSWIYWWWTKQLLQMSLINVTSLFLWGSSTTDMIKVGCHRVTPKALIYHQHQVRLLDLKSGIELSSLVSGYNKNYQVLILFFSTEKNSRWCAIFPHQPHSTWHQRPLCWSVLLLPALPCLPLTQTQASFPVAAHWRAKEPWRLFVRSQGR